MPQRVELSELLIARTYDMHAAWKLLSKEDIAQRELVKAAMGDLTVYEVGPYVVTLLEHDRQNIDLMALRSQHPQIAQACSYTSQFWKLEITKRAGEHGPLLQPPLHLDQRP